MLVKELRRQNVAETSGKMLCVGVFPHERQDKDTGIVPPRANALFQKVTSE